MPTLVNLQIGGLDARLFAPIRWPVTFGTTSPEIAIKGDPDWVDALTAKQVITIRWEYEGTVTEIKNVMVLGEGPRDDVYSKTLLCGNVMRLAESARLRRSWNVRTRSGKYYRSGAGQIQVQSVLPEIAFVRYSLDSPDGADGTVLTAELMLKRAVEKLQAHVNAQLALMGGSKTTWSIADPLKKGLTPNEIELDDPGGVALSRLLALVGGMDVLVPLDSNVKIVKRVLGQEAATIAAAVPYDLDQLGKLAWVSMQNVRPRKLVFGFTPEVELRVELVKNGATVNKFAPYAVAQLQVVDPSLSIASGGLTSLTPTGVWVNSSPWFDAVKALADYPSNAGPFDETKMQKMFLGTNLPNQYAFGTLGSSLVPNVLWLMRVAQRAHYRIIWRLNPLLMGSIQVGSLKPVRCGLLDPITGARQKSPVFADYCIRPSQLHLSKTVGVTGTQQGWNVDSLPWLGATGPPTGSDTQFGEKVYDLSSAPNSSDVGGGPKLDWCVPARAEVGMIDALTGIFRLDFKTDGWGEDAQICPMRVINLPMADPAALGKTNKVSALSGTLLWEQCQVGNNYHGMVVLSCIPGGPNDERQFQDFTVKPEDVLKNSGIGSKSNLGPETYLHVQPSLLTGLNEWRDEHRTEILGWFSATPTPPPVDAASGLPANGPILQDFALSRAASIYSALQDHYEGTQVVEFNPAIEPAGSLHAVTHQIDMLGRCLTGLECGQRPPPFPPEIFMSAGTRRVVLRELQPGA